MTINEIEASEKVSKRLILAYRKINISESEDILIKKALYAYAENNYEKANKILELLSIT